MATELERRKTEEYEMQLFGFTSRAVCATLDRIVDEKIRMCCRKFAESLNKIYKPDENNAVTLRQDIKNLLKAYHSNSRHHASIMKRCIRKLIAVPCNRLLPEDKCQGIQFSQSFQDMEEHLNHLQWRARKGVMLQAALKEELSLIEGFGPQRSTVKMVSTAVEKGLIHPEVDTEMIECVSSCHVVEDIVKSSSKEAAVYAKDISNVCVTELELETAQPNL